MIQYWITPMYINTYYHAEDMILYRYVYTSRCKVGSKIDVRVPFPRTSKLSIHTGIYSSDFLEKGKSCPSLTCWCSGRITCSARPQPALPSTLKMWVHAVLGNELRLSSLRRIINNLDSKLLPPPQGFTEDGGHPPTCWRMASYP